MRLARNMRAQVRVEQLEGRWTPSGGATPANGQEYGTTTIDAVKAGVNIGRDVCSIEKGECAEDSLAFLQPPGQG